LTWRTGYQASGVKQRTQSTTTIDKPYEDIHYHGTGRDPDPEERFTGCIRFANRRIDLLSAGMGNGTDTEQRSGKQELIIFEIILPREEEYQNQHEKANDKQSRIIICTAFIHT